VPILASKEVSERHMRKILAKINGSGLLSWKRRPRVTVLFGDRGG